MLQYIRDRAFYDQDFLGYQNALSQTTSIEAMQKGLESFIELQNPFKGLGVTEGTPLPIPKIAKGENSIQLSVGYPGSLADQKIDTRDCAPKQETQEYFCTPREVKIVGIKENLEFSNDEIVTTARRKRRRVLFDDESIDEECVSTHKTKKSNVKQKNEEESASNRVELKSIPVQKNEEESIGLVDYKSIWLEALNLLSISIVLDPV